MTIVPVIISGGAGSRLWPLSRELQPKPFIPLPDGGTLIGRTYARATALPDVSHVVTVTNRELTFRTADEYGEIDAPGIANTYLLEPMGRDTAAAVALAALEVSAADGDDAILLVMPADHLITDERAFAAAVAAARKQAEAGAIVTFGIKPDRPETGFGYIEVEGGKVSRFVEKPDLATATAYLESGRFFWNSGMFCFAAGTMLAAMEKHCPEILAGARAALAASSRMEAPERLNIEIDRETFAKTPAISIDYAVMEKADNIGFVPCDFGWSDIGSWKAMSEIYSADGSGNRVVGEVVTHESVDCFVHSEDRLVGLAGVSDLIVVDTSDALLVTHKDRAQDVRVLYDQLKKSGHEAAKLHRTAHRPWGTYTVLEEGDRFKIKRIVVKPGGRLSLQAHHHRAEHWIVVSGTAKVTNGDDVIILTTNQSTYIPCGFRHRLENPGILPLVLIEVQSGDYLGEDDIIRFEDVYNRV